MKKNILTMLIAISILMLVIAGTAVAAVPSPIYWEGNGAEYPPNCEIFGEEGGIHWVAQVDNVSASNYVLTLRNSTTLEILETAGPFTQPDGKGSVQFYTGYYDLNNLNATLTFDGTMGNPGQLVISDYCPGDDPDDPGTPQNIPEFPTIALPVAAILGLAFLFQRRKE